MPLFPLLYIWFCISAATHSKICNTLPVLADSITVICKPVPLQATSAGRGSVIIHQVQVDCAALLWVKSALMPQGASLTTHWSLLRNLERFDYGPERLRRDSPKSRSDWKVFEIHHRWVLCQVVIQTGEEKHINRITLLQLDFINSYFCKRL